MLVSMAGQLAIRLGALVMGGLFPGLLLGALYIIYIIAYGLISPKSMPIPNDHAPVNLKALLDVAKSVVPPMGLILLVL
jgi:TRAP-type mannitol/chloroaromatic compound transport system permease large subunit